MVHTYCSNQLLFFLGMAAFRQDEVFGPDGWSGGQWWVGTTIFTATLATILWKAALITEYVVRSFKKRKPILNLTSFVVFGPSILLLQFLGLC